MGHGMQKPKLRGWLDARRRGTDNNRGRTMETSAPVVEVDAELADLIPQYISNRWADLAFARQLLVKKDFELLARMAHRIRGNAASYGFAGLGDISAALETAAEQEDADASAEALDQYDAFLRAVRIEYI